MDGPLEEQGVDFWWIDWKQGNHCRIGLNSVCVKIPAVDTSKELTVSLAGNMLSVTNHVKDFKLPCYYTIDGKPVVSIYDLANFVNGLGGMEKAKEAIDWLREEAVKAGLPGVHVQIVKWGDLQLNLSGVDGSSPEIPERKVIYSKKMLLSGSGACKKENTEDSQKVEGGSKAENNQKEDSPKVEADSKTAGSCKAEKDQKSEGCEEESLFTLEDVKTGRCSLEAFVGSLSSEELIALCVGKVHEDFSIIGNKHFAVNNQEDNRTFANSHVSERALREIYLKGFEICVREAQPMAVMTSYNLMNGLHTANSER